MAKVADPLAVKQPNPFEWTSSTAGNRFDSGRGTYGVLYFGTELTTCFKEVLARFRPDPVLALLVEGEWHAAGHMGIGAVSREWRESRAVVRVTPDETQAPDHGWKFLDLEAPTTMEFLRGELALGLSALGANDLDVSTIRGSDRRVTRLISEWTFNSEVGFAGIKYLSRLGTHHECWALFDDVPLKQLDARPVTLDIPELQQVANLYGLTLH